MTLPVLPRSMLSQRLHKWLATPAEQDWVLEAEWARVQQAPVKAQRLLYAIILSIVCLLMWANIAVIDEVARGTGKVVPSQKLQIVQSLDGGIVQAIFVSEGEAVQPNQKLLEIDPTRFISTLQENSTEALALKAKVQRLNALTNNLPIQFSEELRNQAEVLVNNETQLYNSNLEELSQLASGFDNRISQREQDLNAFTAERSQYLRSLELAEKELSVTRPLLASGAVSEIDILRLDREIVELRGALERTEAAIIRSRSAIEEEKIKKREARLKMINQWHRELTESASRLAVLEQSKAGLEDVVSQSVLRSPVKGTIQRLLFNNEGAVVTPGSPVAEIIPIDDQLIIEAKIAPKDIAFITLEQAAVVRFSAYDFSIYGGMRAEVTHISADSITDDKDNTYYIVRLQTISTIGESPLEILPGMTAEVDIITGERSIIDFILKPLKKAASTAFTER